MVRLSRTMNGYRVAATGPQTDRNSCGSDFVFGYICWWFLMDDDHRHSCMRNLSSSFNINTFITTLPMQSEPGVGDDRQVKICIDFGCSAFEYFHSRSKMTDVGGFLMSSHQSSIQYFCKLLVITSWTSRHNAFVQKHLTHKTISIMQSNPPTHVYAPKCAGIHNYFE